MSARIMKPWWTAFVVFDGDEVEEIDVEAETKDEAREKVKSLLATDYEPGGIIRSIEHFSGIYILAGDVR